MKSLREHPEDAIDRFRLGVVAHLKHFVIVDGFLV